MITFKQIQDKLVEAVTNSSLTQKELAKKLGIKQSTLEHYLYGNTKPSLDNFANSNLFLISSGLRFFAVKFFDNDSFANSRYAFNVRFRI
ncbi:MAG: helix-turn-helix transcriptional regulator [Clostridia bacterium]|nr:helix-turn-helix transcriptional regulator [Clostridia bacterium]